MYDGKNATLKRANANCSVPRTSMATALSMPQILPSCWVRGARIQVIPPISMATT